MDLKELRLKNLEITKKQLRESVKEDVLIIQSIHLIDELLIIINKLKTVLRERFCLEFGSTRDISDIVLEVERFKFKNKEEEGRINEIFKRIKDLEGLMSGEEEYLGLLLNRCCSNLYEICNDVYISGKLIELAGSLANLARMTSSKIQVLGAEKALFRHLKTGARPPKFGVIFAHKNVSEGKEKGKCARQLAAKISIAVKKDYYGRHGM